MQTSTQNEEVVNVVADLVRALVDHPSAVEARALDGVQTTVIEVRTARGDHGKVLGRKGRTIDAARELLVGISGAQKRKYSIELVEPDGAQVPIVEHKRGPVNLASCRFEGDPIGATEDLLTRLVRLLVDRAEAVTVSVVQGRQVAVFEVTADQDDINRIIGIRGARADAARTILTNLGARIGRRFILVMPTAALPTGTCAQRRKEVDPRRDSGPGLPAPGRRDRSRRSTRPESPFRPYPRPDWTGALPAATSSGGCTPRPGQQVPGPDAS